MENSDDEVKNMKMSALLKAYETAREGILLRTKAIYDIAFGTITTLVVVTTYSALSKFWLLLAVIPFILFVGAIIFIHLIRGILSNAKFNFKIERKISNMIGENVLNVEQELGMFGRLSGQSEDYYKPPLLVWAIFSILYLLTIFIGTWYMWKESAYAGISLFILYIIFSAALIKSILSLSHDYKKSVIELQKL